MQIWDAKCVVKEGIMDFNYFCFDIESYSFFRRLEVVVSKNIGQKNCGLYVFFTVNCFHPNSSLHDLRKMTSGKHKFRNRVL